MQTDNTITAASIQADTPHISPPPSEDIGYLQTAIIEIVRKWDHVSFAELPRRLADVGLSVGTGDAEITLPGNIVIWRGMPSVLCAAIVGILHAGRLHLHPASEWTYLTDGTIPRLPIARRVGATYKRPHWLPCVLRLVPVD